MDPVTLANIVIKKVVYERPKEAGDEPKVTITLTIEAKHLETTKQLLDFAAAGPCDWTVTKLQQELAGIG